MRIDEQLDALSSIWDQIALKNAAIIVSGDEQRLLEERFSKENNSSGKSWEALKKQVLNDQK